MLWDLCSIICSACAFWDSCCLSCSKFLWHVSPGLTYCSLGSVTPWMCCFVKFLIFSTRNLWSCFCCFFPLCPTKALCAALSEAKRFRLLSGGLLQPFKSCCPFFRMQSLFLFLGVLVFCLGSGHSPNLCRNPILKLVQLLTYHRQLCSSCDGSESFCMWRELC